MAKEAKIVLSVDSKGAVASIDKTSQSVDKLASSSANASKQTQGLGVSGVAMGTAIGNLAVKAVEAAVGALKDLTAEVLTEVDAFSKFGKTVGLTVSEVAGLSTSFSLAGSSGEGLKKAMFGLTSALDTDKITEQRRAIEGFGISVTDADGNLKTQKQLLYDVADAFQNETSNTKKASLAKKLFGEQAFAITGVLNQGSKALKEQAGLYGNALGYTDEYAASVEELNDSMTKAENVAKGLIVAITDSEVFRTAIDLISGLADEWIRFFAETKMHDGIRKLMADQEQYNKILDRTTTTYSKMIDGLPYDHSIKMLEKDKQAAIEAGLSKSQSILAEKNGLTELIKKKEEEGATEQQLATLRGIRTLKQKEYNQAVEDEAKAAKKAAEESKTRDGATEDAIKKEKELAAARRDRENTATADKVKKEFGTYVDVAETAYQADVKSYDSALKAKKISREQYDDAVSKSLDRYIKAVADGQAKEEDRIKEVSNTGLEAAQIAADEASKRADERMAQIEKEKALQIAYQNDLWALQMTYADSQAERDVIELEQSDAKYTAMREKYAENAAMITEIDKAQAAEHARLEDKKRQIALNNLNELSDATLKAVALAAKSDKKYAILWKSLATGKAIVNTALGVTKALSEENYISAAAIAIAGGTQVATIASQNFATGGIVDGTSTVGDKIPVNVNSGEMILNKSQQAKLFALINTPTFSVGSSNNVVINVTGNDATQMRKMLQDIDLTAQIKRALNDPTYKNAQGAI